MLIYIYICVFFNVQLLHTHIHIYIYILYIVLHNSTSFYIKNGSDIAYPPSSLPGHDLRPRSQIPQGSSQAAAVSRHQHLRRRAPWCHGAVGMDIDHHGSPIQRDFFGKNGDLWWKVTMGIWWEKMNSISFNVFFASSCQH